MKLKLKDINIKHFKGIESIDIGNCGDINAFIGKNNSGKSTILQAIDIASLALNFSNWNMFEPKIEIKDLFSKTKDFEVNLTYKDESKVEIRNNSSFGPQIPTNYKDEQKFKSVLILPEGGITLVNRRHKTPKTVINHIENRNYTEINSLDILYTLKYYASQENNPYGFTSITYANLIKEIIHYFPDLETVESGRTENDIATLSYSEYGKKIDIFYSGTGLKHFVDILLKIVVSEANIVLIDEPEVGLHADLQRQFMQYLGQLAKDKNVQIFLATQSQVILNYVSSISFYKIVNVKGKRNVLSVSETAIHTLLGDLGIRPSDIFNQDICLLVEGQSEVIFFEHIIRTLYKDEFDRIAIGIQQYGGGSADGIISGTIKVSNITTAQKYIFWIHDRDAEPSKEPSSGATKFKNALHKDGFECHIWKKREIEYYYPEIVHKVAQQGSSQKETETLKILTGSQTSKYRDAAKCHSICVPTGTYLSKLLKEHVTSKDEIDVEVREIIEKKLLVWSNEILGKNNCK